MAFPAFFDTCVLVPYYLCDTLLRLADRELFRPLWSAEVLSELQRTLVGKLDMPEGQAASRVRQMRLAFPDAEVSGYEHLIDAMTCDPKDRHVLAAAVRANAEVIVTANLDDFPLACVAPYGVTILDPDRFLLDQLDLSPRRTLASLDQQVRDYKWPPRSVPELLPCLERSGAVQFAAEVRRHIDP